MLASLCTHHAVSGLYCSPSMHSPPLARTCIVTLCFQAGCPRLLPAPPPLASSLTCPSLPSPPLLPHLHPLKHIILRGKAQPPCRRKHVQEGEHGRCLHGVERNLYGGGRNESLASREIGSNHWVLVATAVTAAEP